MSAIAVICRDDGIVIANDTIAYDDAGIVRSVSAGKVQPILELNCVIGNVGAGNLTAMLRAQMAQKYRDFDEVLEGIVDDFRFAYFYMVANGTCDIGQAATVVLCGWSAQRGRPEAYRVSVRDKEMHGPPDIGIIKVPAFTLASVGGDWCSSSYEKADRFALGVNEETDSIKLAARYICAARARSNIKGSGDFDGIPYYVGGEIHVTVLRDRDIRTFVAHHWPDEIGKPLDKDAGDPMPAHLL